MDFLQALPTELHDFIFECLDQHSTLSLIKTCKRLFAVGLPHLYHSICLTWAAEKELERQPHIASLLRTVVTKPALAASIQAIEFKSRGFTVWDDGHLLEPRRTSAFTSEDKRIIQDLSSGPQWADESKYGRHPYEHEQENDFDIMVVAVLCQLPNLRSLRLGAYFMRNYHLAGLIQHAAKPRPETTVFRNLEHVSVCTDMDQYQYTEVFEPYIPMFMLPSLIGLASLKFLYIMPIVQFSSQSIQTRPCTTQLTSLRFKRIILDRMSIVTLLEKCPNLTALECNFYPKGQADSGLDCDVLMTDGLKGFAKTLKHLCIGIKPLHYEGEMLNPQHMTGREPQYSHIGTRLSDFSALETLEIGLCVLLGWTVVGTLSLADVLPQHLKTLTIRNDCWGLAGHAWREEDCLKLFREFLEQGRWRDVCPELERMNLRLERSTYLDWVAAKREEFCKLCGENGVEGRVRKQMHHADEDDYSVTPEPRENTVELNTFFDD
jgi:hypothetical protein